MWLTDWRTNGLTKCNTSTPIFTKIVNWEQLLSHHHTIKEVRFVTPCSNSVVVSLWIGTKLHTHINSLRHRLINQHLIHIIVRYMLESGCTPNDQGPSKKTTKKKQQKTTKVLGPISMHQCLMLLLYWVSHRASPSSHCIIWAEIYVISLLMLSTVSWQLCLRRPAGLYYMSRPNKREAQGMTCMNTIHIQFCDELDLLTFCKPVFSLFCCSELQD